MASRPLARNLEAWLAEGGDAWLIEQIASGRSLSACSKELGVTCGFMCQILRRNPDLDQQISLARKRGADALVDETLEIADNADSLTHNAARLQVNVRQWVAGKWHPERYGERQAAGVVLNVGQLHLNALRDLQLPEAPAIDAVAVDPDDLI